MTQNISDVVAKYISLRDAKEAEVKVNNEAIRTKYSEPMEIIEKWLLQNMEAQGVDSLKTPAGTPYKNITKSIKTLDSEQFKRFVFTPVIDSIVNLGLNPDAAYNLLSNNIKWDMIDFRALKSGVTAHVEETGQLPPGLELTQFTTINIRRS